MEALGKINIGGEARQMLDIIIRKTYGYQKKHDPISTSQFISLTGLNRKAIYRGRKKLFNMNLITMDKSVHSIDKNVHSQVIKYSFQKDYNKWKVWTKKGTVDKNATGYPPKCPITIPLGATHKRNKETITKDNTTYVVRDYFYSSYKQVFGQDYVADFGKDGKIFKGLANVVPIDELKILIDRFFASKDKFIIGGGFTVGVFKSQVNKLRIAKKELSGIPDSLKKYIKED